MKNKSDCSAYPEGNYSPTVGKGAPTLPEVLYGAYYVAHAGAQEKKKERAVDVPLTLLNLRPPEMHKTPK